MTKKKLAILEITKEQIKELDKKIYMLELDRRILFQEYCEMSERDEVIIPPPPEPEIIPDPLPIEDQKDIMVDKVITAIEN